MKKKLLAVVLSVVMTLGCVTTCMAATAESFTSVGAWAANSGTETLTGDFDVTYTFRSETTYASNTALSSMCTNFDTVGIEIRSGAGDGCFDMRPDVYGWWWGTWAQNTAIGDWATWSIVDNDSLAGTNMVNWADWQATFAAANMTLNITRVDNTITVNWIAEGDNGITYDITAPIASTVDLGDTITITLVAPTGGEWDPDGDGVFEAAPAATVTVTELKFADNNQLDTVGAQANTAGDKLAFVSTVSKELVDDGQVEELGVLLVKGDVNSIVKLDDVDGATVIKGATQYVTSDTGAGADDDSYAFRTIIKNPAADTVYTAIPYMVLADGTEVYGANCSMSLADVQ